MALEAGEFWLISPEMPHSFRSCGTSASYYSVKFQVENPGGLTDATQATAVIGGLACILTMYFTVYRPLRHLPDAPPQPEGGKEAVL